MTERVLSKNDIEDYILPHMEVLKTFFSSLKLKGTLLALDLLGDVLDIELEQVCKKRPLKKIPRR